MTSRNTLKHLQHLVRYHETELAPRVVGEARALVAELPKLHPHELTDVLRLLTDTRRQILNACDVLRDLRRTLQARPQLRVEPWSSEETRDG